jgi:trigger factor
MSDITLSTEGYFLKRTEIIPPEHVQAAFNKSQKEAVKKAEIPGFRKGKAPLSIVLKHYNAEIQKNTEKNLFEPIYKQFYDEVGHRQIEHLQPASQLTTDPNTGNYVVSIEMAVYPEVEELKWQGLALDYQELSQERIAEETQWLEDLILLDNSVLLPVNDRTHIEANDDIVCRLDINTRSSEDEMTSFQDNYPILIAPVEPTAFVRLLEAAQGKRVKVANETIATLAQLVQDGWPIAELWAQCLGKEKGQSVSIDGHYPSTGSLEEIRGKDVTFSLEIQEIKQRKQPEVDDEFIKSLGIDSIDVFRKTLNWQAELRLGIEDWQNKEYAVVRALAAANPNLEVADSMMEEYKNLALSGYTTGCLALRLCPTEDTYAEWAETIRGSLLLRQLRHCALDLLLQEDQPFITHDAFLNFRFSEENKTYPSDFIYLTKQPYENMNEYRRSIELLHRAINLVIKYAQPKTNP